MRIGVIGAGTMGAMHAGAWAACPTSRSPASPPALVRACTRSRRASASRGRFARVVRGEADPELLGAAAARDGLRIVAAARESVRRGERVGLDAPAAT